MENFKIFFNHVFFMLEDKIEARLRRLKGKENPPEKGHFKYVELVQKALKIYNLTTTNAIQMKLTRIIYLHNVFFLRNT